MVRSGAALRVVAATVLLSACGSAASRSHGSVTTGVTGTDGAASTTGPSVTTGPTITAPAPTTGVPAPAVPPAGAPSVPSMSATGGTTSGAVAPASTAPAAPPHGTTAPTTGAPPPPPSAPPSIPSTTSGPTTTRPPASAALAIRNFSFQPATLRVAPGTVVTVTNDDTTTHTWTADGAAWDSGPIAAGSNYRHTFTTPGTFTYHCNIHPYMTGTVQVA